VRPGQTTAADIDMPWNLESLPIQWMRMSSEGRPGSTCLTSNRMVLGPRLPSIAIVPHATIPFWMGYRGWRPSPSLLERSSLNRPKVIRVLAQDFRCPALAFYYSFSTGVRSNRVQEASRQKVDVDLSRPRHFHWALKWRLKDGR
jgi:hypothetical protein